MASGVVGFGTAHDVLGKKAKRVTADWHIGRNIKGFVARRGRADAAIVDDRVVVRVDIVRTAALKQHGRNLGVVLSAAKVCDRDGRIACRCEICIVHNGCKALGAVPQRELSRAAAAKQTGGERGGVVIAFGRRK
ncbi:hypothetical protein SDC9_80799 [bioreactor metagenome]|uniref:Uncharacterized protein n=1 Tax=bioreactor metagenome TaxID=1076179 RepID=A0A644Z0R3_9ZZZZ